MIRARAPAAFVKISTGRSEMSLRSLTRFWLAGGLKTGLRHFLLGHQAYAPSFSSAGEDMILRHVIGSDKMDGFYVDVGAYDPVHGSNTHFFYIKGWRGINVEARPGSRKLFERVRPRDINLEVGVSKEPGHLTYYFISEDSTMNSFSREFLEHTGAISRVRREILVPVMPLSEILERHLPAGQTIDFMNVDVEGHDLQALESNDWGRFRPRFVVVEDAEVDAERSEIVRFMRERGYGVCAQNVIILDKLNEYFFVDRTT
jgi:FkbM family methyltransferase